jgi:hypothetical protein
MMTEKDLLVDCIRRLNRAAVPHMLTGSMASNYRRWAKELGFAALLADLLEGRVRPKRT